MKFKLLRFFTIVLACVFGVYANPVLAADDDTIVCDKTTESIYTHKYKTGTDSTEKSEKKCVRYDQYVDDVNRAINDTTDIHNCPEYVGALYSFKRDGSAQGIESCTLVLTNTVCDKEKTKVIYTYNTTKKKYIRKSESIVDGARSVKKGKANYPAVDDLTNDYCDNCTGDTYNVNGKCAKCNTGYCIPVDDNMVELDSCGPCPEGYQCPGPEQGQNDTNLYCKGTSYSSQYYVSMCPKNTYAEVGAAACTPCPSGSTTEDSGPEEYGFNGSCLDRTNKTEIQDGKRGYYGIGCISRSACKALPPMFCLGANCVNNCSLENKDSLPIKKVREECATTSFPLGDSITRTVINSSVISMAQ